MKRKTGKFEIISFYGGFHGRTSAAATAGGLSGPEEGLWAHAARGDSRALPVLLPLPVQGRSGHLRHALPRLH